MVEHHCELIQRFADVLHRVMVAHLQIRHLIDLHRHDLQSIKQKQREIELVSELNELF